MSAFLTRLAEEVIRTGEAPRSLASFMVTRPAVEAQGRSRSTLKTIDVMVADKPKLIAIEESMTDAQVNVLRDRLKLSLANYDYDYVLIDLPGNLDKRNRLAISAMVMSDFMLIPVEPSEIALNALTDTFAMIHYVRMKEAKGRPAILGLVLNKVNRSEKEYQLHFKPILESACKGELPPVFDAALPDSTKLAIATDATLEFTTLQNRFDGTTYDHARDVALELERRCRDYRFPPRVDESVKNQTGILQRIFERLMRRSNGQPEQRGKGATV